MAIHTHKTKTARDPDPKWDHLPPRPWTYIGMTREGITDSNLSDAG